MTKQLFLLLTIVLLSNKVISQNHSIKKLVESTNNLNLDLLELVQLAKKNLNEEKELARFFYQWIGTNISYDYELLAKAKNSDLINRSFWESQNYDRVYENRKGVCAGYSKLFQWFMHQINIEVVIIYGHIRSEKNHYVELESDDSFRHAWNAIKLNNKWMLIDSTWGTSGEVSVSDFYFDIKPEFAIITHYPEESRWQLLDNPLSLKEFNNSKFIKQLWFYVGFSDIPSLKEDGEYYYFVYKNNPNRNWLVRLGFGTDSINYKPVPGIKVIEQGGYIYYRFNKKHILEKTAFKVDLNDFNEKEQTFTLYENIILFKI